LAKLVGVSVTTFRKWLRECDAELRNMGVGKNAKLLPPCAVKFVCNKYSIDLYEDELYKDEQSADKKGSEKAPTQQKPH